MVTKVSTFVTGDGKKFENAADAKRHEARGANITKLLGAFPQLTDAPKVYDWFVKNFRVLPLEVKTRAKRTAAPAVNGAAQTATAAGAANGSVHQAAQ